MRDSRDGRDFWSTGSMTEEARERGQRGAGDGTTTPEGRGRCDSQRKEERKESGPVSGRR